MGVFFSILDKSYSERNLKRLEQMKFGISLVFAFLFLGMVTAKPAKDEMVDMNIDGMADESKHASNFSEAVLIHGCTISYHDFTQKNTCKVSCTGDWYGDCKHWYWTGSQCLHCTL